MKKKHEANLTPLVLKWFRDNGPSNCAIEIKVTDKKTIPKSALMEHQKAALLAAAQGCIVHKITDEARRQQPFDAFKLSFSRGFVVACFTGKKRICKVIDVQNWKGATVETAAAFEFIP